MRRSLLLLVVMVPLLAATAFGAEPVSSLDPSFRGPGSLQDASPQRRPQMLSVFLNLHAWYWWYGGVPVGLGGRFYQPILHDGLVPSINDSLGVEVGADLIAIFGRTYFGFGLGIPVEVMWSLYFSHQFSAYLKLGIALELHFGNWYWNGALYVGPPISGVAAVGIVYKLTEAVNLRVELGYPGLKVGLGFPL